MTPAAFARIMDRAYCEMRPWSADEIADTLANPHVVFLTQTHGGLIAQIVAEECEILALATDPESQRTGVGSALMTDLIEKARAAHADRIFLDVASRNHAARAFYDARDSPRLARDGDITRCAMAQRTMRCCFHAP